MNTVPWLGEGLAVSFGRQHDYLRREEFLAMAPASPAWNARFANPAQRYVTEYLKHRHGPALFAVYLRRTITAPERGTELFERTFQVPLGAAIASYQRDVRAGAGPPPEE